MTNSILISKGSSGWGGPLKIKKTEGKTVILSEFLRDTKYVGIMEKYGIDPMKEI